MGGPGARRGRRPRAASQQLAALAVVSPARGVARVLCRPSAACSDTPLFLRAVDGAYAHRGEIVPILVWFITL